MAQAGPIEFFIDFCVLGLVCHRRDLKDPFCSSLRDDLGFPIIPSP